MNRTKIIATLGPASSSPDMIRSLIDAGMDAVRLNFSHGDHAAHAETLAVVRSVSLEMGVPVTVIQDLQGPKIRLGNLPAEGITLESGETRFLVPGTVESVPPGQLPVDYPSLAAGVRPGMRVLIDDGLVTLEVIEAAEEGIRCRVVEGGVVLSRKGVNLPDTELDLPSLTEKDHEDLLFGLEQGVDWVSLSFVRQPEDILSLRSVMEKRGIVKPVIAKIEKPQALDHLDAILDVADGVMVARGDLGVEMSPQKVPLAQKRIIEVCNRKGIPVITATQMLESMIKEPIPTRAEASDVANAIIDGTDAVMLSGETAVGCHPVAAVKMMASIASEVEEQIKFKQYPPLKRSSTHALSEAVTTIEEVIHPVAITLFTASGYAARLTAAERPRAPILALTNSDEVCHALNLIWGIRPVFISETCSSFEDMASLAERVVKERLGSKAGETILIMGGIPPGVTGGTNFLKIHVVR